jgi:hypothetical protein
MSKIEVPANLRPKLGLEMKMDVHWIDIKLRNGTCFYNMTVRGGLYITGYGKDENDSRELPFKSEDIVAVRRRSLPLWPFW